MSSGLPLAEVGVLALAAAVLAGPRLRTLGPLVAGALRAVARPAVAAALLLCGLLFAARQVVDVAAYLRLHVAAATLSFALLWLLALRFDAFGERGIAALLRLPAWGWAGFAFAASLAAGQLLLDGVPHTSDEAAYQFQARAFEQGRIGFEIPPGIDFFGFIHVSQVGRWYGTMEPGWSGLLALGRLVGAGALVNPILAGLAVLGIHAAARAAGFGVAAARVAALLLALCPSSVFLGGSYLSHTSNIALFVLFLWAGAKLLGPQGRVAWSVAALAGLALALNALVRPLDSGVAALPFAAYAGFRALRTPRLRAPLALVAAIALAGVAVHLAYNAALTGDPLVLPQERYFENRMPAGQRFGYGFGADMGTRMHGDEWPGYYPSDAPRVSGQRLLQWLVDLYGAPWVVLTALLACGPARLEAPWRRLCLASAALLIASYGAHFYHGLAYGARHYALALPALALAVSVPIARALGRAEPGEGPGPPAASGLGGAAARAALLALLAHTLLFATPPLVREYGRDYRMASGALRDAAARASLDRALVFVHPDRWGWKSGFPLNELPLESNPVLFARDLGARNAELLRAFPERAAYRARIAADGSVAIRPLGAPAGGGGRTRRGAASPGAPARR